MARFIRHPKGPMEVEGYAFQNNPINIDLVIEIQNMTGSYHSGDEAFPLLIFWCVGGTRVQWLFESKESRDAFHDRLSSNARSTEYQEDTDATLPVWEDECVKVIGSGKWRKHEASGKMEYHLHLIADPDKMQKEDADKDLRMSLPYSLGHLGIDLAIEFPWKEIGHMKYGGDDE